MTNARDTEQKDLKKFMDYKQSTHNAVVTSSVGMAILQLRKIYFGTAPDEKIPDKQYQACIKELRESCKDSPKRLAAAEYFIKITQEPYNEYLDVVKLTERVTKPDSKETVLVTTPYLLELKEVITLAWKAVNDDKRYLHHYAGTDEQKLEASKKDKAFRLESFFNCLESINAEKVCHHGNRNELVFLLNNKFENISIIEDDLSTVRAILKDEIHKKFWVKYKDEKLPAADKKALLHTLYEWMNEGDASKILTALEGNKPATIQQITDLFITNGSDPAFIKLDTTIQNSISSLVFACHPNESKDLHRINSIFNYIDEKSEPIRNKSLATFKKWLLEKSDLSLASDLQKINIFFFCYETHVTLCKAIPLFAMTGYTSAEYLELKKTLDAFFANHQDNINFAPLSPAIIATAQRMQDTYVKVKASNMSDQIESFFANWNAALKEYNDNNANIRQIKTIYSMLLSDIFKEKVQLKDKDIETFLTESAVYKGEVEITPYLVNRFLLHAILTPEQWSEKFSNGLEKILAFIKSNFNQPGMHVTQALNRDSYNRPLLERIKTLAKIYTPDSKNDVPPTQLIIHLAPLIPEHCKFYHDWVFILHLTNKATREKIYGFSGSSINKNLIEGTEEHRYDYLTPIRLKLIPVSYRLSYFLELSKQNKLQTAIATSNNLLFALLKLPENARLSLLAILPNNHLKKILDLDKLFMILALLPVAQRLTYATKAIQEILNPIEIKDIKTDAGCRNFLRKEEFITVLKEIIQQPSLPHDEKDLAKDTNPTLMTKFIEGLTLLEKLPIMGRLPSTDEVQAERVTLFNHFKSHIKDWTTLRSILHNFNQRNQAHVIESLGNETLNKLTGSILQKKQYPENQDNIEQIAQDLQTTRRVIPLLFATNDLIPAIKNGKFSDFNSAVIDKDFLKSIVSTMKSEVRIALIKDSNDLLEIMPYLNPEERFRIVKDFLAIFDKKNFSEKPNDKNNYKNLFSILNYLAPQERMTILAPIVNHNLLADDIERIISYASSFIPTKKTELRDEKSHPVLDQKSNPQTQTALDWVLSCWQNHTLEFHIKSWRQLLNILKHLPQTKKITVLNALGLKHIQSLSSFDRSTWINNFNIGDSTNTLEILKALDEVHALEVFFKNPQVHSLTNFITLHFISSKATVDFLLALAARQRCELFANSISEFQAILKLSVPLDNMEEFLNKLPLNYLLKQLGSFENLVTTLEALSTNHQQTLLNRLYKLDPKVRFDALQAINRPGQKKPADLHDIQNALDCKNELAQDQKNDFFDSCSVGEDNLYIVTQSIFGAGPRDSLENLLIAINDPWHVGQDKIFFTYEAAQYYIDKIPNSSVIIKINQPSYIAADNTIFIEKPVSLNSVQWHKFHSRIYRNTILNKLYDNTSDAAKKKLSEAKNRIRLLRDGKKDLADIINQLLKVVNNHLKYLATRATKEHEESIGYKFSIYDNKPYEDDLNNNKHVILIKDGIKNSKALDLLILRHLLLFTIKNLLMDQSKQELIRLERLIVMLRQPVNEFFRGHEINECVNNYDSISTVLQSTGNIGLLRISEGKACVLKIEGLLKQFKQIVEKADVKYIDEKTAAQAIFTAAHVTCKK